MLTVHEIEAFKNNYLTKILEYSILLDRVASSYGA